MRVGVCEDSQSTACPIDGLSCVSHYHCHDGEKLPYERIPTGVSASQPPQEDVPHSTPSGAGTSCLPTPSGSQLPAGAGRDSHHKGTQAHQRTWGTPIKPIKQKDTPNHTHAHTLTHTHIQNSDMDRPTGHDWREQGEGNHGWDAQA